MEQRLFILVFALGIFGSGGADPTDYDTYTALMLLTSCGCTITKCTVMGYVRNLSDIFYIMVMVHAQHKKDRRLKMKPILEARNISKVYGRDRTQVTALEKVSLRLNAGECVILMGASR